MKCFKNPLLCLLGIILMFLFTNLPSQASELSEPPPPVNISCPTDYPFLLFDNEQGGRQITSQIFHIVNYGSEDVIADLSNIDLEPSPDIAYQELSSPVDSTYASNTKDVFVFLKRVPAEPGIPISEEELLSINIPMEESIPEEGDYILTGTERPEDYKIILKAADYDENGEFLTLTSDSVYSFYIAGSATPNKDLVWNQGDISIYLNIKFNRIPTEVVELPQKEEDIPAPSSSDISEDAAPPTEDSSDSATPPTQPETEQPSVSVPSSPDVANPSGHTSESYSDGTQEPLQDNETAN